MSTALKLQFFRMQAINYSVIIVKIKCKIHNMTNRKSLPWCKLINPCNFFIVNVFRHTSRKTSRRDIEAPETLESLGCFKVSASVSEAATSRLGLVLDKILNVSVSETWVSGFVAVSAHPWYKEKEKFQVQIKKKKSSVVEIPPRYVPSICWSGGKQVEALHKERY